MQFAIEIKTGNLANELRRAGYHYLNSKGEEMNFVRALGQDFYPRFHLFVKENRTTGQISCALHLDQKKPSYAGSHAHSGEYDNELLKKEATRISSFFNAKV